MAKKSGRKAAAASNATNTEPKYPYTIRPAALRKFLKLVPDKPKPAKINKPLLQSWGMGDTNALTIIRVLKAIDLVAPSNEPTQNYQTFMQSPAGPAWLGKKLRDVYPDLFNASKAPHKESEQELRKLFNIHTGGAEQTIQYQMQTFKALAEYATFDGVTAVDGKATGDGSGTKTLGSSNQDESGSSAKIHIDLHIHLPPDKSSRDYQAIFEDIGRYIMGRKPEGGNG